MYRYDFKTRLSGLSMAIMLFSYIPSAKTQMQCKRPFIIFTFRPVDCIRGFSRETLIEMTSNIESQELHRRQNWEIGYAEHPRAGGTDDLETFFSIAHRYLGMLFSLKQFKEMWQKLVRYVYQHLRNTAEKWCNTVSVLLCFIVLYVSKK